MIVLGTKNKIIFSMIDLKRKIKEDPVFLMKAKTHLLNVLRKRPVRDFLSVNCFIQLKIEMIWKI